MKQIGTVQSSYGTARIFTSNYGGPDGPLAVVLELEDDVPLGVLSVNMYRPDCSHDSKDLPANCFYVKQWSENEDIARDAFKTGLFKLRDDLPVARSGFVSAPVWEIKA